MASSVNYFGIREIKSIAMILFGIASASFGIESFLIPNGFIDGGVVGISMLAAHISGWPLYLWVVVINLPFIIMGALRVNIRFAVRSIIAIALLAFALGFFHYPEITHDKLLTAVFGGFFLGLGIGFAVRGSSVIDGTEILALTISKNTFLSVGDVVLVLNVIIFSFAAFILSLETAMYSLMTYFVASKTLDFVVHGIEEYYGLTIISQKQEEVKELLKEELNKSITLYQARGGRSEKKDDYEVIFLIVTKLEVNRVMRKVLELDSEAFIAEHLMGNVYGGIIKKRGLQE